MMRYCTDPFQHMFNKLYMFHGSEILAENGVCVRKMISLCVADLVDEVTLTVLGLVRRLGL